METFNLEEIQGTYYVLYSGLVIIILGLVHVHHTMNNFMWVEKSELFYYSFSDPNHLLNAGRVSSSLLEIILAAWKRSPIPIQESEGNPQIDFLVVIMASGIAHQRVCTTMATVMAMDESEEYELFHINFTSVMAMELHKTAATLQLIG